MPGGGELRTGVTLFLAEQAPELAKVHNELYPERVYEHIPLSLTLLYPFAPRASLAESQLDMLRDFFVSRESLAFDLARIAQWEGGGAVYAVPEPDEPLRATMRALWQLFPEFPPYGGADDPPPHVSLTLDGGEDPAETLANVERRLEAFLPAHFEVNEAVLMGEYEPDRWHLIETFPFGQGQR